MPVALHLDHGTYEDVFKCIEAGFTSVMYDGSHEASFEINLERTAEVVKAAHAKGISVEAEVGGIGGVEDGERLGEIKALTGDLPLVLHGGTGIPVDQIQKAISLGISKINVNTDLQVVFAEATRKYIEEGKDQQGKGYDPRKLLKPGRDAIVERTKELMEEFGSTGKGWA